MTILELSDVSKSYGQGKSRNDVLANVNLKVKEGEFIAIVGFSGAGKTTLISSSPALQGRIRAQCSSMARK